MGGLRASPSARPWMLHSLVTLEHGTAAIACKPTGPTYAQTLVYFLFPFMSSDAYSSCTFMISTYLPVQPRTFQVRAHATKYWLFFWVHLSLNSAISSDRGNSKCHGAIPAAPFPECVAFLGHPDLAAQGFSLDSLIYLDTHLSLYQF